MRRLLIAAAVVAGMTIATSTAMAQGRYYGGPSRVGVYGPGVVVQSSRQYRAPSRYYRSGRPYYRDSRVYRSRAGYRSPSVYRGRGGYRNPSVYRGRGYYQRRPGMGVQAPGFSIGIGF